MRLAERLEVLEGKEVDEELHGVAARTALVEHEIVGIRVCTPHPIDLDARVPQARLLSGIEVHRDARLLFREGWILLLGLVLFGALGSVFLAGGLPRGLGGILRLGVSAVVLVLVGGLVAPWITKTLNPMLSRLLRTSRTSRTTTTRSDSGMTRKSMWKCW